MKCCELSFDRRIVAVALAIVCSMIVHSYAKADVVFVEHSGKRGTNLATTDLEHIKISGPIIRRDVQALSRALTQAQQYSQQRYGQSAAPYPPFVLLDSPGGDILAAMDMGKLLRSAAAWVFSTRECSSACVFVLAAGVRRFVSPGSQVGLHRPRFDPELFGGLSQVKARELYENLIEQCNSYLLKMGLSRELLQQMLKIPSQEIRFVDKREAEMLGLDGEDPSYAEWDRARLLNRYGEEGVRKLYRQYECLSRGLPIERCQ